MGQGSDATYSHYSYQVILGFLESMFLHLLHDVRTISRNPKWLSFLLLFSRFACFTGEWAHGAPRAAIHLFTDFSHYTPDK